MDIDIPFGQEKVKVKIQEPYEILIPKKIKVKNEKKTICDALKNPIGIKSFKDFLKSSKKLLVIVNDASKPTPTLKILEQIYPELSKHSDFRFLIATGTHKPPTEEECKYIFKEFYEEFKDKIFIHNSKDKNNLKYLGKNKNGNEIFINKMVTDIKNVIVIGSVEPHYFAGYTGGRKAFFPGVSSYETVEGNHRFALSDKACSLNISDNPIHDDLIDSIRFLKDINIFSIQIVLTRDYRIYAAKCGDILKSHNEIIKFANDVYCVPIKNKGNIVISIVPYPMDINLYQSQHALENGRFALEDDGIIILVSKCRMGIGNDAFLEILSKTNNSNEILELLGGKYKLGSHKSVRILNILSKANIFAVTELEDKFIEMAKMKPYSNIQSAVDDAIELISSKGKKPRIIIMPCGNLTVPII
jgi:nickel-dependent lactate racemase